MIQFLIYSISTIMALMFINMNHPLAMGLMLLIQTILICLMAGTLTKTFWFSYITFLIFVGGMLVLFIYVTSLASNEMFTMSSMSIMLSALLFTIMLTLLLVMDKSLLSNMINNEIETLTNLTSYMYENTMNLNKLYNYPTNIITIMLINYLLITLIATVKITNIFYGPLRPMN